MKIPLEDNAGDVIGKAQRGFAMSDSQLAQKSGLEQEQVRRLRAGEVDAEIARRIAPVLELDAESLAKLAAQKWEPETVVEMDGLAQFNTEYGDMTVNAYLAWDPKSREAIAFDTGADCEGILQRARDEKIEIKLILLTHSHEDHVADLKRLKSETGAPVFIGSREGFKQATAIEEGKEFEIGALRIETLLTWGHSLGGVTYVVRGLARPVAVVGDSMFAGSMGGGSISYHAALQNNLEKILTLPDETIVCPGHGPLTTVGKEKRENPFFAGRNSK